MDRRRFLTGISISSVAGLAGCIMNPVTISDYVRPDDSPEPVSSELHCGDEDRSRHPQIFSEDDIEWGNFEAFELRVSDLWFTYGETATITLQNRSIGTEITGIKEKFNFEAYTRSGWEDVRVGEAAYPDVSHSHRPWGGFDWEIELTENGVSSESYQERFTVCPDLMSGRYRFVYWGIGNREQAVAVAFDITTDV